MNSQLELLNSLGQVAGIGGVALGVLLLLFRDVIRKKIFPQLTKRQGYRVVLLFLILTWSVAIAGIIAWMTTQNGENGDNRATTAVSTITASLWRTELDTKGSLIDTTTVTGSPGGSVDEQMFSELVAWTASTLGVTSQQTPQGVQVTVEVPANLAETEPTIKRTPEGNMNVLMWHIGGGGKSRLPLDLQLLREMRQDFSIEIQVPGFDKQIVEVTWGKGMSQLLDLTPATISIAVEQFLGDTDSASDRLTQKLNSHGRFRVVSPEMLNSIKEEIRAQRENIARNPMMQQNIRRLGVDYIISGSVSSHL